MTENTCSKALFSAREGRKSADSLRFSIFTGIGDFSLFVKFVKSRVFTRIDPRVYFSGKLVRLLTFLRSKSGLPRQSLFHFWRSGNSDCLGNPWWGLFQGPGLPRQSLFPGKGWISGSFWSWKGTPYGGLWKWSSSVKMEFRGFLGSSFYGG